MKAHRAASLFPMFNDEEMNDLVEDIKVRGLIHPIILFEDMILDGRNRWRACRIAKVEPRTETLKECDSPTAYVISANLKRRHLNALQKALVAAKSVPFFEEEAAKRQRTGKSSDGVAGGRGHKKPSGHSAPKVSGKATDQAAKATGAGQKSTKSMVAVAKHAPDIVEAIEAGLITNVSDAKRCAGLDPKQRSEVLGLVRKGKSPKQAMNDVEREARIAAIGTKPPSVPNGRYQVLLADPPWKYDFSASENREIENQYPTMTIDAICELPVPTLAEDDAVLFLWATSPKLPEALRVMDAWGFTYKTCMVWIKDKIGMGYYARQRHEFLLIGTKGKPSVPPPERRPDSVIEAPRGRHSEKPERAHEVIESMYPDAKRVELFARRPHKGWEGWGNEL